MANRENNFRATDKDFEDRLRVLLNDNESDCSRSDISDIFGDDSDADPEYLPEVEEDVFSDTDMDDDGDVAEGDDEVHLDVAAIPVPDPPPAIVDPAPAVYLGRGKEIAVVWSSIEPPRNRRTLQHNIIRGLPGLTASGRALDNSPTVTNIWHSLMDQQMCDTIIKHTNTKLANCRAGLGANTNVNNYKDMDFIEFEAFIGLLLFTSIFKSAHENMLSMFSKGVTGRPIFLATMSVKRFEILLMCLRFDDPATRDTRRKNDRAALISEIFESFIANSQKLYCPKENVTADEMLIPFRGRCQFRQYMPNKPGKYGIKVFCLTDSGCGYLYNAFIYTDKDCYGKGLSIEEQKLKKPTQAIIKLTKPLHNSNRNVTADNWFSTKQLADELSIRGLTYVGTLNANKPEVPKEFLKSKYRKVGETLYGFNGQTTLVSFVPKKNKAVNLISTMHHTKETDPEKNKPEIICYYNKTKGGVDLLDMKCANYSCNRRCQRWPLVVYYMLLNASSVNAFILYLCFRQNPLISRFQFVKQLAMALIEPHLRRRLNIPNLRRDVKRLIQDALHDGQEQPIPQGVPDDRLQKRKTCSTCPSAKQRKTAYKCIKCSKPICLECSRKVCLDCAMNQ